MIALKGSGVPSGLVKSALCISEQGLISRVAVRIWAPHLPQWTKPPFLIPGSVMLFHRVDDHGCLEMPYQKNVCSVVVGVEV